jgi:glycosyltransferase involved in cell wall biosynthesis
MRIVFIQRPVGPGGSKNSLLQTLIVAQRQHDFDCRIAVGEEGAFVEICRAIGIQPLIAKIPEWRKWPERFFFRRRMNFLAQNFRSFAPDYVISNEMWWAPHAVYLAKQLKCKSACVVRDTLAVGPKARQYNLHKLDRVLCISAAMRDEFERATNLRENVRLVYNPVVPPTIQRAADQEINDLLKSFSHVEKWLLVAGRVGRRKNQIEAVRILARIRQDGFKNFGLILAGKLDTDYLPSLRNVIAQFELENFVCLPGQINAIGNLIQRCDATLLTSQREGLPRSIIESFLLGKPCFSMPLPGLEEIYDGEQADFVSRGQGAAALAPLILDALRNPEKIKISAAKVQQFVTEKFSPENHWRQFVEALG